MTEKIKKTIALGCTAVLINVVFSTRLIAATSSVFVCEYESREDGRTRSKIQVKATGLPRGSYYVQVLAGGNMPVKSKPKKTNGRLALEFEFDSNSDDAILEGKTEIPPNFTQGGFANGVIRKAKTNGQVKVFRSTQCRIQQQ
ncbi:MAG: hypothetical protein FJ190_12130 [Gammaproteobacteria bacterium]|nr:hypothetical protein [Gammaproteobacteria bacterium]